MISLLNVSKNFKGMDIVDGVSLDIHDGMIFGLRGQNGSGKTTLLRIMSGLVVPTRGSVVVDGITINPGGKVPDSMGALIDSPGFLARYSGLENLMFLASLGEEFSKEDACSILSQCGLDPTSKQAYRKYSLGMKQRLGIAAAFVSNPRNILLDEPTNGLDASGPKMLDSLILGAKQRGACIVIASHDEAFLRKYCDAVATIEAGRLAL